MTEGQEKNRTNGTQGKLYFSMEMGINFNGIEGIFSIMNISKRIELRNKSEEDLLSGVHQGHIDDVWLFAKYQSHHQYVGCVVDHLLASTNLVDIINMKGKESNF